MVSMSRRCASAWAVWAARAPGGLLPQRQRGWRQPGELPREISNGPAELPWRHDAGHEADLHRLRCRELSAGQHQLEDSPRRRGAEDRRQDHQRKESELDLREPEDRVVGRDDEIAGRGAARSLRRQRVAVHLRDHRGPHPRNRFEHARQPAYCSRASRIDPVRNMPFRSAPAQKARSPAPRMTTTRASGIPVELGQRRAELPDHRLIERVPRFGRGSASVWRTPAMVSTSSVA